MLKKTILLLLAACSSLSAQTKALPHVIDYGYGFLLSMEGGKYAKKYNHELWKLGGYAFNSAPELAPVFAALKRRYNIDAAVETGTFLAWTTIAFAPIFNVVHTVEINESNFNRSKEILAPYSNVHCHFGNSADVLKTLLPSLKEKRVLFYLDAHWKDHWPLLEELDTISQTHYDKCIIVIDDFKVPNRKDIPYDSYGVHECSIEYIKNHLDKNFSAYNIHYLIPKSVTSRAKLIAIPKNWREKIAL